MMRQYELVERVLKYDPKADEALLNRAYVYAMKAHGHQKRASGAPYFSHPLEVAAILTELKLDDATIATALLHDVIEDTDATRAEIDQMFGPGDRQSRRRPDEDQAPRSRFQKGRTGGKLPQASHRDLERHPRAARQARRPFAQHADARAHEAREPPAQFGRDARYLRAARRNDGHAGAARGTRGSRFSLAAS